MHQQARHQHGWDRGDAQEQGRRRHDGAELIVPEDRDQHRQCGKPVAHGALALGHRQRHQPARQHRQRDQDRILHHPVEGVRSGEAGKDASDHAAERHPHVERGEVARGRPPPRQLAVAHQGADEEHDEMNGDDGEDIVERAEQRRDQQNKRRRPVAPARPANGGSPAGAGTRSRRSGDRARAERPRAAAPRLRRSRYAR